MPVASKAQGYRETKRQELAGLADQRKQLRELSAQIEAVRQQIERGETWTGSAAPLERRFQELSATVNRIENQNESLLLDGCPDRSLMVKRRRLQAELQQLSASISAQGKSLASELERQRHYQADLDEYREKHSHHDENYVGVMAAEIAACEEIIGDSRAVMTRLGERRTQVQNELRDIEQKMIAL